MKRGSGLQYKFLGRKHHVWFWVKTNGPILVYYSGDWDVHWVRAFLTISKCTVRFFCLAKPPPVLFLQIAAPHLQPSWICTAVYFIKKKPPIFGVFGVQSFCGWLGVCQKGGTPKVSGCALGFPLNQPHAGTEPQQTPQKPQVQVAGHLRGSSGRWTQAL